MKNKVIAASLALFSLSQSGIRANTRTTSNTLSADIQAAGSLAVTSSVPLTHGTTFNPFTGTDTLTYRARTTSTGTGGTITLKSTADFAAGGPAISRNELTYTCGAASLGVACSGTTTVTTSASAVVTLPKSATSASPNTVVLTFSLLDNPVDKTGNYTATITFTISAT